MLVHGLTAASLRWDLMKVGVVVTIIFVLDEICVSVLGVTWVRLILRWGWQVANTCDHIIKCTLMVLTCATCYLARQMVTVRLEADVQDGD